MPLSRDSRWLAAAPFKQVPAGPAPYVRELFLYDLSELNDPAK